MIRVPITALVTLTLSEGMGKVGFMQGICVVPGVVSATTVKIVFLRLCGPSCKVVGPVVEVFGGSFASDILLLGKPTFVTVAYTCVFFAKAAALVVLNGVVTIPRRIERTTVLSKTDKLGRS